MWEQLWAFNVPPRLYHCVLRALWRKLLVAARIYALRMTPTPDCTLCTHHEDHAHILKRCLYLCLPCSVIRRLWGAVVHESELVEPSRLCLEHGTLAHYPWRQSRVGCVGRPFMQDGLLDADIYHSEGGAATTIL